jgi:hypothetical protein
LLTDLATSQFRVWQCEAAVPSAAAPSATITADGALPCVAVDDGVWPPLSSHGQAVWLGTALGDTLLLFDGVSGARRSPIT